MACRVVEEEKEGASWESCSLSGVEELDDESVKGDDGGGPIVRGDGVQCLQRCLLETWGQRRRSKAHLKKLASEHVAIRQDVAVCTDAANKTDMRRAPAHTSGPGSATVHRSWVVRDLHGGLVLFGLLV